MFLVGKGRIIDMKGREQNLKCKENTERLLQKWGKKTEEYA